MTINQIEMILVLLVSFFVGLKLKNNERIENPVTAVKNIVNKKKEIEQEKKEAKNLNIMLNNIDRYDGTTRGQQDLIK
nr:MAG TPA: hypothetical protein [Caudoviricetes sp.]